MLCFKSLGTRSVHRTKEAPESLRIKIFRSIGAVGSIATYEQPALRIPRIANEASGPFIE